MTANQQAVRKRREAAELLSPLTFHYNIYRQKLVNIGKHEDSIDKHELTISKHEETIA